MDKGSFILSLLTIIATTESGYIFTIPQVLLAGSEEKACLTLNDVTDDVTVNIMLVDRINAILEQVFIFPAGENGCVSLKIPYLPQPEDRHVNLMVTGVSLDYNFTSSTPVIIRNDPTITFIQTDKPIYKPGQTVKFRILTIDDHLRTLLLPVSEVTVINPDGVRIRQWSDITGEDGLLSLDMELSEEPVVGVWKIEVVAFYIKQTQTFKVEEYVLPTFEVTVKPPPFLPADSPSITGEVCAEYTYGKKVTGVMQVEVCIKSPHLSSIELENEPPCDKLTEEIDGCKMFSIDSKFVNLGSAEYPLWDHRVYINATVTESNTGISQYGISNSAKVIQEALKLDFTKSSKFFKPGLPFKGKLRVRKPNGSPAPDEPIKVAAVDYDSGVRAEEVFVSNKYGEVYFVLPREMLLLSKEVTLLAEAIRYKDSQDLDDEDRHVMYQPTALVQIQAWYSPSKSYIQIFPVEEAIECGKELTVGVAYTTTPGSTVTFHYQVVSRGNIVATGQKSQHFNLHEFEPDDKTGILSVKEGEADYFFPGGPPVDELFDQSLFSAPNPFATGSDLLREIEQDIAKYTDPLQKQPIDPYTGSHPVKEDFIAPAHYEPLGKQPQTLPVDPFAGRKPVEEDFIHPEHYEPLGKQPQTLPVDPFAGRKPVEEDFIHPEHYEPLGRQPQSPPVDPFADRKPVEEDFIQPKHYEPLGKQPQSPPVDPYADRKPVEEDFLQPKHYEPLGKQPQSPPVDPYADRKPVEEDFIQPKHYEPLGKQSPSVDPYADRKPVEEDFIQPKHYQPLQKDQDPTDYPDKDSIKEGDTVFIKQQETILEESTHVSYMQLTIPVTMAMSPEAQLLVYHIRQQDQETVADAITFKVKRCFQNKVDFKFKKAKLRPGKRTTVRVNADSGSLCGIGVVDKSVHLASKENQMTPETVYRKLGKYNIGKNFGRRSEDEEYCRRKMIGGPDGIIPPILHGPPGLGPLKRKKRQSSVPPFQTGTSFYSPYVDAMEAFRTAGLTTLSDLDIQTRPCELKDANDPVFRTKFDDGIRGVPGPGGPLPVPLAAAIDDNFNVGGDFDIDQPGETLDPVRSYFPDTWLWDLMRIGDPGLGMLTRKLPDTITEWVGGAFCVNPNSGLGVSPQASITTFQPFFISYTLPYSTVRGERIPVIVTVFNYLKDCLEIKLSLKKTRKLDVEFGQLSASRCVCGGESDSHTFYIIPKTVGKVRVAVDSRGVSSTGLCSNNSTLSTKGVGARDRVVKSLFVEPEGITQEYTYSAIACPRDYPDHIFKDSIKLKIPPNVVEGSVRGTFSVIGDLIGLTVDGLHDLIQLPTGCGEQNMLNFAPIISVLQYLKVTNQLEPRVEQKAKEFIKKGYQRQLMYRHTDGAYSAFGKQDETGSMWLTAFVVKTFSQAAKHIFIDKDDLEKSIMWLQIRQLDSGCFPPVGQVVHKEMRSGLAVDNQAPAALTAYILAAMLEANISRQHPSVQRAVRCLESADIWDAYTITLASYALTLYDVNSMLRAKLMDKLHVSSKLENEMMHWERKKIPVSSSKSSWQPPYRNAASVEIEMTAYALMAYISGNQTNSIMVARPVVQWLTHQRNANGGFVSTQDTVVALQALALFGTQVYTPNSNLTSIVKGERFKRRYEITDSNKLVLQSSRIRRLPNELRVTAEGVSCALIRANVRYNVLSEFLTTPPFSIKVNVFRSKSDINNCKKRTINICTQYQLPGGASNMAIVDVKMVTGWVPIKETIAPVTEEKRLGVKRFEIENNHVNFYFEEMTSQKRCFEFEVFQKVKLSGPKAAYVKVYDYYETDHTVIFMYNIKTTCGTKEEIPFEITDDVGPLTNTGLESSDPFFVEQRRVPGLPPMTPESHEPFFIQQRRVQPVLPPFLLKKLKAAKEKEKQSQKVECPVCLSERPRDYPQRYCAAEHAYKTYTGREGVFPLKIQSDFRPKKAKIAVNGFARFSLNPACPCPVIGQSGKAMILAPRGSYNNQRLTLNSGITIVPITKQIEKESRQLSISCTS